MFKREHHRRIGQVLEAFDVAKLIGASVEKAFLGSINLMRDKVYLQKCLTKMSIDGSFLEKIPLVLEKFILGDPETFKHQRS